MPISGWLKSSVKNFSLDRRAFINSFRVCDSSFHDLLNDKFILSGCSMISIASLMMRSKHYHIQFQDTRILAMKTRCMEGISRETRETELHSDNMNREKDFSLTNSWK
jgi:hypothetical protein